MQDGKTLESKPFNELSPDLVIDAVESIGYVSDLRIFPLNSYENRVYQIGIEDADPLIAKFYRPGRWSDLQILEEHEFSLALSTLEIPIISPLQSRDGQTLLHYQNYRFSLYPRRGGYAPELTDLDTLFTLGQHIGRIHTLGMSKDFYRRPSISLESFGIDSQKYLLKHNFLPDSLRVAYESLTKDILKILEQKLAATPYKPIRLHGDCHPGNILQRPDSLYLVDLDDSRSGPAVQDLWMLLSGDRAQQETQLEAILEGYEEFCEFNHAELKLIEVFRSLRIMHYAAWLAKRWEDPAFPIAFPWFNTETYWAKHILELREQFATLQEPSLSLPMRV